MPVRILIPLSAAFPMHNPLLLTHRLASLSLLLPFLFLFLLFALHLSPFTHRYRASYSKDPRQPTKEGSPLYTDQVLFRRESILPGLATSPRLLCPAPLPKNQYGIQNPWPEVEAQRALAALGIAFPPNWSYLNFSSLRDLCSAEGKTGANFGGEVGEYINACIHTYDMEPSPSITPALLPRPSSSTVH